MYFTYAIGRVFEKKTSNNISENISEIFITVVIIISNIL